MHGTYKWLARASVRLLSPPAVFLAAAAFSPHNAGAQGLLDRIESRVRSRIEAYRAVPLAANRSARGSNHFRTVTPAREIATPAREIATPALRIATPARGDAPRPRSVSKRGRPPN